MLCPDSQKPTRKEPAMFDNFQDRAAAQDAAEANDADERESDYSVSVEFIYSADPQVFYFDSAMKADNFAYSVSQDFKVRQAVSYDENYQEPMVAWIDAEPMD
jgi:hypothetical protein